MRFENINDCKSKFEDNLLLLQTKFEELFNKLTEASFKFPQEELTIGTITNLAT